MNKTEKKEHLREKLLERRSSITEEAFYEKSVQIQERLEQYEPYIKADTIHCYISLNERREVNTHPLIKEMLAAGKEVVVPVTQIEAGTLRHVWLDVFEDLQANEWGVPEPVEGEEAGPEDLELIIVPMVGGDYNKNRIGYGKGFYDRFLQQVHCPAVGLLFEECLIDAVPVESFDVPLSMLITEQQIIQ
jgi:5-formyltetrahydrofolate cyclo-ligase